MEWYRPSDRVCRRDGPHPRLICLPARDEKGLGSEPAYNAPVLRLLASLNTPPIFRRWAWLVAYVALVPLSFWPQSAHPGSRIAYVGDSLESVYIVGWIANALSAEPTRILDPPVLHPQEGALALTDHRLLPSVVVAPIVWLTGNPVLAYNVAVALVTLLAAAAARRLSMVLGADAWGAWAAGALCAFNTYQINEAPRLNILTNGFLPLIVAALVLLLSTGERRHAWVVAALCLAQGLSSNYHLLYACLLIAVIILVGSILAPRTAPRRTLSLFVPALLAAAVFSPVAATYLRAATRLGYERSLPQGIDLVHYLSTSPTNLLYGPLGAEVRLQQRAAHFIGFITLALTGVALLQRSSGSRQGDRTACVPPRVWVPIAAGLAIFFIALSLGRDMVVAGHSLAPGPYRLLHEFVPGFRLVRIPERLGMVAMIFVACLVGQGITWIRRAGGRRMGMVLALAVPLEHVSPLVVTEDVPVGRRIPAAYQWLAESGGTAALAEVPVHGEDLIRKETLEMYYSLFHRRPTIHGYTAYPPLLSVLSRRAAGDFPSPGSIEALRRVGVDTVVFHAGRPGAAAMRPAVDAAARQGRISRLARFTEGHEIFRLNTGERLTASPPPHGVPLRRSGWRYEAKVGDAFLAFDGDMETSWTSGRPIRGDEYIRVRFDRPESLTGLRLRLGWNSALPSKIRVIGLNVNGRAVELATLDGGHFLQLLESARRAPRTPSVGWRLDPLQPLLGLALQPPTEGAYGREGWRLPEIELLAAAGAP